MSLSNYKNFLGDSGKIVKKYFALRYYDTFGGEAFCFSIWKSVTAVIRHPYINDINYSDKINNCCYFYHKNGI